MPFLGKELLDSNLAKNIEDKIRETKKDVMLQNFEKWGRECQCFFFRVITRKFPGESSEIL